METIQADTQQVQVACPCGFLTNYCNWVLEEAKNVIVDPDLDPTFALYKGLPKPEINPSLKNYQKYTYHFFTLLKIDSWFA